MNPRVDKWLDEHFDDIVKSLQESIAFKSLKDGEEATEGAPFGKENAACLDHALGLAEKLGFGTKNLDGFVGYADMGEGEEQLALLCHLDVVPEGTDWKYPAFGGEIHDGRLYGRGALDDKGPAIFALYAMAAVRDAGLKFKRRVRLILGCDEESGMGCLAHYNKIEPAPDMAFSPDAEYPVVNSEKLIFRSNYEKKFKSNISLHAGIRPNVVPGKAVARVPFALSRILPVVEAFLEGSEFACAAVAAEDEVTEITMTGLDAHASLPEMGKNALLALIALLDRLPLEGEDAATIAALASVLKLDMHGEGFGLDETDPSGRLTLNPGVMDWDESGIVRLAIDIRAPISMDGEVIKSRLAEGFDKAGLALTDCSWSEGYYMPPESELVSKLLDVYEARAGERLKPIAMGGGTYARHLKNAVAFGCERPGVEAPIHMPNEYIRLDDISFNAKMLADAIIALACE